MLKRVFVLRIGDYRPDLCKYTIPTIKAYAEKIGAEYVEITESKYTDLPITCEKFQVYGLGLTSDWNILVDADVMIHPNMPDVTQFLPPEAVASAFAFDADRLFKRDRFFERDGRNIGIASNFVVTSRLTHDVWNPSFLRDALYDPTFSFSEYTSREFIFDEYILSRNLAKYGLKHSGILPMPQLEEMIVHFGNEEQTEEQKNELLIEASALSSCWNFGTYGDSK